MNSAYLFYKRILKGNTLKEKCFNRTKQNYFQPYLPFIILTLCKPVLKICNHIFFNLT